MLKRRRDPAAVNSRLIRRPIQRMFWLFLLPMTGAFCIGFVYPFLKGLFLSFCKFKTTSKWTWVGLANYGKAFADPKASGMRSGYTAIFAIVSLIIINVLAFAVAYALTQGIKGTNVFRTVFFMPNLIGGIVLGYIWSMIFDGVLSAITERPYCSRRRYGFWGLDDPHVLAADRLHDDHLYRGPAGRAGGYAGGGKDRRRKHSGRRSGRSRYRT